MFIDIHAHCFWERPPISPSFPHPEELIAVYDALGIEKGFLLPIVNPEYYLPQSNEEILRIAALYPDRFVPFCNIDPRALSNSPMAKLDVLMQHYKDRGCRGIGEVMPGLPMLDYRVQNLFACAEKVGLPVIYEAAMTRENTFGMYDEAGLPGLEITLQRFPNLKIFGHGPTFWAELSILGTPAERGVALKINGGQCGRLPEGPILGEGVVPKLMRRYPNLYADLSDGTSTNMFMRDEEFALKFIDEFQDRIFFGTDYCNIKVGNSCWTADVLLNWRKEGKLREEVFQKIARENALRLFEL